MPLSANPDAFYSLDESSGNAADATGNCYTLTNINTMTYGAGLISNAAQTANNGGSARYLSASPGWSWGSNCSISVWVKGTDTGSDRGIIGRWNTDGMMIYQLSGDIRCYAGNGSEFFTWTGGGTTVADSNWHHLVFTKSGTSGILYHNGSSVQTGSLGSTTGSGSTFNIGSYNDRTASGYTASIDLAGVWATATLTSGDVTTLYNGGVGLDYPFTSGNPWYYYRQAG